MRGQVAHTVEPSVADPGFVGASLDLHEFANRTPGTDDLVELGARGDPVGVAGEAWVVSEIRALHDTFDPIQDDRSLRIEQNFVHVRVKLANGKASSGCQTAQRVTDPCWHTRDIVEAEYMRVISRDE